MPKIPKTRQRTTKRVSRAPGRTFEPAQQSIGMETAQILIRIPAELHFRFKMKMTQTGRTMRECLLEHIASEVEGYNPPRLP